MADTWTIGGSECAAAAGVHPYSSRVSLWLEKTGRVDRTPSDAMRWGTLIEPLIREQLERENYDICPAPELRNDWKVGHPDGFIVLDGERGVLEVKTANQWAHGAWDGDVPVQYAAQVQWYLHLAGLDRALLAVLVAGQRLETHRITRDDRAIDGLVTRAEEFLSYLRTDTPPPPDGSDSARDALAAMFPANSPGKRCRLSGAALDAARELPAIHEAQRVLAEQRQERENIVKAAMGDAEIAISPSDVELVRWTVVTSHRVDTRRLKTDHPAIAAEYLTDSTTRRFTLL